LFRRTSFLSSSDISGSLVTFSSSESNKPPDKTLVPELPTSSLSIARGGLRLFLRLGVDSFLGTETFGLIGDKD